MAYRLLPAWHSNLSIVRPGAQVDKERPERVIGSSGHRVIGWFEIWYLRFVICDCLSLVTRHLSLLLSSGDLAIGEWRLVICDCSIALPVLRRDSPFVRVSSRLPALLICNSRIRKIDLSSHRTPLITEVGECGRPGWSWARRAACIFALGLYLFSCHSSLITRHWFWDLRLRTLFPVTSPFFNNSLSFHQHRGKNTLTILFSSTSWRGEKATFFLHLFSITFRLRPLIFRGIVFSSARHRRIK